MIENNDKGPKGPRIYLPNLFAQAQRFWVSMKKMLHWASVNDQRLIQSKYSVDERNIILELIEQGSPTT